MEPDNELDDMMENAVMVVTLDDTPNLEQIEGAN